MESKRKIDWAEAARWTVLMAIAATGAWLALLIIGEESAEVASNSDAMYFFVRLKLVALLGMVGLYHIGCRCRRAGLLPRWWEEQMKELEKDEKAA